MPLWLWKQLNIANLYINTVHMLYLKFILIQIEVLIIVQYIIIVFILKIYSHSTQHKLNYSFITLYYIYNFIIFNLIKERIS